MERCFLFLEELGAHGPLYNLCFSAPFPARETNRKLQAAAFNRRFPVRSVFCRCGGALKFIFSIQIVGLGSLVSNGVASCGFSAGHTCEEDDTCKSNVARPGMDSGLFWCSKHIIQQCSSGPKSVDHVLLVSVLRQNLLVWPRWKCWFVLKSWFFPHLQVSYSVGVVCRLLWATELCGGQNLQHSKDLTLTDDALMGITWRVRRNVLFKFRGPLFGLAYLALA